MNAKRLYCWVVPGCLALAACQGDPSLTGWSDIGSPDDIATRQAESRANRGIPKPTEMPPGLGEDLPMQPAPPVTRTD